jgi:hypothetical protein
MQLAPLRTPRPPFHVHFVGAMIYGSVVAFVIVPLYLGVWAVQLVINLYIAAAWVIFALVREPTRLSFLLGFGSEHPAVAAHRDPPAAGAWRGYDRPLLDDDPPTMPIPVQPGKWEYRLRRATGQL